MTLAAHVIANDPDAVLLRILRRFSTLGAQVVDRRTETTLKKEP